jgi:signal transduction histidine kinase
MSETGAAYEGPARTTDWRMLLLGVLALIGTAVLVALVNLQVTTDRERDEALRRQAETYEVIIRAGQLSTAVAQAESALGRYVVSADKTIGQAYSEAWSRAAGQLNQLAGATRADAVQQAEIRHLRRAFDARGKELGDTALYSVFQRNRDALGRFYQVSDTAARAEVESRLARIVERERNLLRERTAAARALIASSRSTTRILAVFGLLIVIGAILLGVFTVQALGQQAVADADADAERVRAAVLQEAVAAATAQLRDEMRERESAEAQLRQVQKMEAVGQLTGGIAHDFNNMLAVVLGGLELAKRHLHTGGPDANRHIENAMEGANRAATLTRRLLVFSREEALLPAAADAGAIIRGMTDLFDRTLGDGIEVVTRDEAQGWRVWIDRHQLENALLNLAVNARDAMDGRGTLTLATQQRTLAAEEIGESALGDYVAIAATDTGSGMTPEIVERVFEPFFTTKPVGKGTGLGLSQIFGFVRQSGGEIGIDTAPGKGTTVTLYLPRYTGEAASETQADDAPIPEVPARALDILVVEDDPRVLTAMLAALTELGHRPVGCGDPIEAPAALQGMEAIDLLVSDVLMPGQTGPEMVAALGDKLASVPVLYVTGYAGEVEGQAFGGYGVLRKPFTMAALARAVEEAQATAH